MDYFVLADFMRKFSGNRLEYSEELQYFVVLSVQR